MQSVGDFYVSFFSNEVELFHSETCAVVGLPTPTLQNWAARGLLTVEGEGKGNRRRYSTAAVAAAFFGKDLISLGIETGRAIVMGMNMHIQLAGLIKAGMKKSAIAPLLLQQAALVSVDESGEDSTVLTDLRKLGPREFPIDRGAIFYPVGARLTHLATEIMKVKTRDAA